MKRKINPLDDSPIHFIRHSKLSTQGPMDTLKKHIDTIIILGAFASSVLWMNTKFNDIDHRFNELEKEIAVVKTVLIMRDIMPRELAKDHE